MDREMLAFRAAVMDEIRSFFKERSYLEVDTPLLAPALIPESSIEIFQTRYEDEKGDSTWMNLIPSPEIWMKVLLARGAGSMFQICKCFRNSEPAGGIHNPEFTMLEYYTVDADYMDSISLTEELFSCLTGMNGPGYVSPPFVKMSMEEAFLQYAGFELGNHLEAGALAAKARQLTGAGTEEDSWEELYNRIFVTLVEPCLPVDRPVLLYDYPAAVPTLAKEKTGTPWAERWELYSRGVELANCFTEETNREKVMQFFKTEMKERERKGMPLASDPAYTAIFSREFPRCSGVALGVDRLIMLLAGKKEIEQVIPFPFLNTRQPPL